MLGVCRGGKRQWGGQVLGPGRTGREGARVLRDLSCPVTWCCWRKSHMACNLGFSLHFSECPRRTLPALCLCTCLSCSLPPAFMPTCQLRAVALLCPAVCGCTRSGSRRLLEVRAEPDRSRWAVAWTPGALIRVSTSGGTQVLALPPSPGGVVPGSFPRLFCGWEGRVPFPFRT